jgi:hypothetical protein
LGTQKTILFYLSLLLQGAQVKRNRNNCFFLDPKQFSKKIIRAVNVSV